RNNFRVGIKGMYIRDIARTLYELKKKLEELERAYDAEESGDRRDSIELELAKARYEHEKVRCILEGAKGSD
ncbi:MAG: hypothetical protein JSU72_10615, partial [Deltaproteobacteria bacterium]